MTDFGIRIRIDTSEGSKIAPIKTSLSDVEGAANRASTVIAKGFADAGGAAESMRQRVAQAVNPFDSLTAALEREQKMLERIHGPGKQYAEDMQTLGSLLERNKISTEEYTAQVERLHRELEKQPGHQEAGNPVEKIEGSLGAVSGLIGGGIAAEGMEIAKSFTEMLEQAHKLEDEYTNLKNATLGFKEAGVSTDATVNDMRELAETLQSKLPETINLYRRLDESADHLGLTHEQIEADVKAFGAAALASGHTLDDAASATGRLSIAMQTGQLDARSLNSILKTMPDVAKAWEAAFHESTPKILKDIQDHKISIRDLMVATAQYSDVVTKGLDGREKTHELSKEEISTNENLLRQRYNVSAADAIADADLDRHAQLLQHNHDGTLKYYDALDAFDAMMKQVNATTGEATSKNYELAHAVGESMANGWHLASDAMDEASAKLGLMLQKLGAMEDKWGEGKSPILGAFGVGMADASKLGNAKEELAKLDKAYELSGGHLLDYAQRRRALTELIGGDEVKLFDEIVVPMQTYNTRVKELSDLLAHGAINASQFETELLKLDQTVGKSAMVNTSDAFIRRHGNGQLTAPQLDISTDGTDTSAPAADPVTQRKLELYRQTRTAAEKYKDELEEINGLGFPEAARTRILADLEVRYGKVGTATEQYARAVKDLNDREAVGLVSAKAVQEEQDKLATKFGKGDAATGMREGIRSIATEMNTAASAQKLLVDGFHGVRDSIVELATTGTTSFGKLFSTIMADLAQLAANKLLKDLLNGGSSGETGGLLASALGGLGGAATGGDFDIPHAANGFAGIVRHQSGGDSHLAMFHVNPGEHVAIRTPEQQAAAQRGHGPVVNNNRVVVQHDPHALLDALDTPEGNRMVIKLVSQPGVRGALKAALK